MREARLSPVVEPGSADGQGSLAEEPPPVLLPRAPCRVLEAAPSTRAARKLSVSSGKTALGGARIPHESATANAASKGHSAKDSRSAGSAPYADAARTSPSRGGCVAAVAPTWPALPSASAGRHRGAGRRCGRPTLGAGNVKTSGANGDARAPSIGRRSRPEMPYQPRSEDPKESETERAPDRTAEGQSDAGDGWTPDSVVPDAATGRGATERGLPDDTPASFGELESRGQGWSAPGSSRGAARRTPVSRPD